MDELERRLEKISSRQVINVFKEKEFEGISKNKEIGFLICAMPDGSVDVKDLNPDISSESTFFLTIGEFKQWCPDTKGVLIFGHTHGVGLSENSKEDRFSMLDIFATGQGDILCATGIDGVTCHISITKPPLATRVKWGDDFYDDLARIGKREPIPVNSLFCEAVHPSWLGRKVLKKRNEYKCSYRLWSSGFDDTSFGNFDDIILLDSDSHDSLYPKGAFKMAYGNLECLNFEPTLICRDVNLKGGGTD